ncbi:GPD1 [Mytilus edulis]|uniref:Glycerol-3-phosphate dehydrogenase [NAD(+)] n=1 Tax=Mytilus edulis TaxID=6550 RepID=A0A8S3VGA7_MYTED|nr:GPD1 [Mytilus edulis]
MSKKSVCIVGSGNWGSAIAKILGKNAKDRSDQFETCVKMWMYEEMVDGRKLTEIVNTEHENVKYLPGVKIPENVVAIPDLIKASEDADILIFVLPHQFVAKTCEQMKGKIKPSAIAVSLIKGVSIDDSGMRMISNVIKEVLEVAQEQFCETTIGCAVNGTGELLKSLFETPYFRCSVVTDQATVELCGALKNIVGIGAGIADGLGHGDNTKAAVIRLGLMEMIKFSEIFIPGSQRATFFESCGISDLVATCHGGRNRMLGEHIVKSDKTVKQLEKELLKGQSFQGPLAAREIFKMLKDKNLTERFPLFVSVHYICLRESQPEEFINCLRNHPEHI